MGWLTKVELTPEEVIAAADPLIQRALDEDLGVGDLTTEAIIDAEQVAQGRFLAKEALTVCGIQIVQRVFEKTALRLQAEPPVFLGNRNDGTSVKSGDIVATVSAGLRVLLSGERVALNFLQRLSGIATATSECISLLKGKNVDVLDTRKTIPGYRILEKYAVRCGGGTNHRYGLYDAFLIKNNHIDAIGGDLREAVRRCKAKQGQNVKIEVECRSLEEVKMAIESGPDAILLDNFTPDELVDLVKFVRSSAPTIKIEASGGITSDDLAIFGASGVDALSMGSLTHSARAVDIAMRIAQAEKKSP